MDNNIPSNPRMRNGAVGRLQASLFIALSLVAFYSLDAQDIVAVRVAAIHQTLTNEISDSVTSGTLYRVQGTLRFTNLVAMVRWTNQILLGTSVLYSFTADSYATSNSEISTFSPQVFTARNFNVWSIAPTTTYFSALGGTGTISVASVSDKLIFNVNIGGTASETNTRNNSISRNLGGGAWTATVDQAWLAIVGANSSNADGMVTYTIKTNFTGMRIGHVVVAGKTNTVIQAAASRPVNDFDNDRCSDITIYDPKTGAWYIWSPAKKTVLVWNVKWGYAGTKPVPGDFDGDWYADLAVYDPQTGVWYIRSPLKGKTVAWNFRWGYRGAQPVPGDYDGDGWSDPAVYDPKTTKWYIHSLRTGANLLWNFAWGVTNADPVPGDYDGDGRSDIATYDPQTSTWDVWSLATRTTVVSKLKWGYWGAEPVPADYNGDDVTEKAIYDALTGTWKISFGSGSESTIAWGYPRTLGVPGDYNGDGNADLATCDANGRWYIYSLSDVVLAWELRWGFPEAIVSRNNAYNPAIDKWSLTVADNSEVFGITGLSIKEKQKELTMPQISPMKYMLEPGWYQLKTDYYGEKTVWSNGLVKYKASGTLTNKFRALFPDSRIFSMTGGVFSADGLSYTRPVMTLR